MFLQFIFFSLRIASVNEYIFFPGMAVKIAKEADFPAFQRFQYHLYTFIYRIAPLWLHKFLETNVSADLSTDGSDLVQPMSSDSFQLLLHPGLASELSREMLENLF